MNEENPLVSIIVITYNSSKFVLETLESAKAQTYRNIELIVSDDASTDNTVEICREWLEENRERFVRTELITIKNNSGIPANCNRGVKAAKGEWVKLIAGDDVLFSDCIIQNILFCKKTPGAEIVFSKILLFSQNKTESINSIYYPKNEQLKYFDYEANVQYDNLLKGNFIWVAPSSFIKTSTINHLDYFNEAYPFIEDYPFWLKATKNNIRLFYLSYTTVYYRQNFSITRNSKGWYNVKYFSSLRDFFEKEIKEELKKSDLKIYVERRLFFIRYTVLIFLFKNNKNLISRVLNRFLLHISRITLFILRINVSHG